MSLKVLNRSLRIGGAKRVISDITIQALDYDGSGNILRASGTTVPTGGAGYAKGCLFMKTDVATGSKGLYENVGTTSAASFNLIGDIAAGEITLAEGSLLIGNSSGVAAALDASTDAQILVGNGTTLTSVAVSGAITIDNAGAVTIANDAVSLEHLDAGITPSHIVVFAGEFTTAGGDANETISEAGVLATDLVHVTLHTAGSTPRTIIDASASADQIDVVMSGDPSTDHVLTYSVLRAAA